MSLSEHLQTGLTTVCRCWSVVRRDGEVLGFTDHDSDLAFEDVVFRADTGLSASEMDQSTGLSVDNAEVIGALSHEAIREVDVLAGRFDGAEVTAWLVNWKDITEREIQFRGALGEITRRDGQFSAELRGIAEALNRPVGRIYQKPCAALLGDAACGVDLDQPGLRFDQHVIRAEDNRVLVVPELVGVAPRWFDHGRLDVMSGAASGLSALIKNDRSTKDGREIELWEQLRAPLVTGDLVRLESGCDKRLQTCRVKFANTANFRGFPHIPGEDWLMAYPSDNETNDGGSRIS